MAKLTTKFKSLKKTTKVDFATYLGVIAVFIDTFDEIAGFFSLGGIPAQNLILAVQRNRLLSVLISSLTSYPLVRLYYTRSARTIQGLFHK